MKYYECLRCSYSWYSRLPRKPKVCPRCKSYVWDKHPRYLEEAEIEVKKKKGLQLGREKPLKKSK